MKTILVIFMLLASVCSAQTFNLGQDLVNKEGQVYGQVFNVVNLEDQTLIYICSKQMIRADWTSLSGKTFDFDGYQDWRLPNASEIRALVAWKTGAGGQIHGWFGCASWVWTCEASLSNPWNAYCYNLYLKREGTMFKTNMLQSVLVRMVSVKK